MKSASGRSRKRVLKPTQVIVIGFATAILVGAFLLSLPIANTNREWVSFVDALFTSTTSLCGSGLTVYDTGAFFNIFGQIVILLLIQIGGLGVMAVATLVFTLIRKKISYSERLMLQQTLSSDAAGGVVKMTRYLLACSAIIEGAGFVLLLPGFIIEYGAAGIFKALFTAVSSFCNAGIDVCGASVTGGFSISPLAGSVSVLLSMSFLVILGGLGFTVILDVVRRRTRFKKYALHTKLVLIAAAVLLAAGTLFFLVAEYDNPDTLGGMNFGQKLLNAFFLAVTPRTAGFSVFPPDSLTAISRFFTMFLMIIGGSPASTAGGVRTTTIVILLFIIVSAARDKRSVIIAKRRINFRTAMRAVSMLFFAVALIVIGTLVLFAVEAGNPDMAKYYSLEHIIYEVIAALSTAGLTLGITPHLSAVSKLTLALLMFVGKLGPLTLGLLFASKTGGIKPIVLYPDANVIVG
ncbi:MAG: Trk family potassium uptake protein [Clostridiales bacterium]|jgi:trk system potassium uptake protein TrkH|nr:Trk family potassium uptake protein [Clostridiales bacterium]